MARSPGGYTIFLWIAFGLVLLPSSIRSLQLAIKSRLIIFVVLNTLSILAILILSAGAVWLIVAFS